MDGAGGCEQGVSEECAMREPIESGWAPSERLFEHAKEGAEFVKESADGHGQVARVGRESAAAALYRGTTCNDVVPSASSIFLEIR